jgi:hypothetical protein
MKERSDCDTAPLVADLTRNLTSGPAVADADNPKTTKAPHSRGFLTSG